MPDLHGQAGRPEHGRAVEDEAAADAGEHGQVQGGARPARGAAAGLGQGLAGGVVGDEEVGPRSPQGGEAQQ